MRVDDAVGAVPVHLGAGVWGTLAVALLGDVDAFPAASSRFEQLGIQLVGIGVCFVWAFGWRSFALTLINRRFPLRIDREGELAGLNIAEHGASTEIADLLSDIDEQRRSGDFARPVRVEPHTEVGRIAAEYNRVLAAIGRRTDSLQLLRRTAAAANESSSLEEALAVALREVCRFTGWPIGHAFLVSRDDPDAWYRAGSGTWAMRTGYGAFREATEARPTVSAAASRRRPPGRGSRCSSRPTTASAIQPTRRRSRSSRWSLSPRRAADHWSSRSRVPLGSRAAVWVELGLRAGLAVPIMAGADAVGVLEFISDEPFAADDGAVRARSERRNAARARRGA